MTAKGNETNTSDEWSDGNDRVSIDSVWARDSGANVINMGNGRDTLNIFGRVESENDSRNEISLGEGSSRLSITGSVRAFDHGTNNIIAGSGDDDVTISGGLRASDSAKNNINLGDGDNSLYISYGVDSYDKAANIITTGGDNDTITISSGLYSEFDNSINAGGGDNCVTIRGGLGANGGDNSILCGDGDDTICIWGVTRATDGGENHVETGGGNDVISLHGNVEAGALIIDAGDRYDTLVLNGSRVSLFETAYEDWLTDYAAAPGGLASMNIENFEVTLTRTAGISDLQWLSDLTAKANINLQLNINGNGRNLNLNSFFEDGDDVFHTLSMQGGARNTLTIDGTLSDNHYDDQWLRIIGDSNDTVRLSGAEWKSTDGPITIQGAPVGHPMYIFDYYTNIEGDMLAVQNGINVIV